MTKLKRIASVDILRGLTIVFMIMVNTPGTWSAVYPPLLHAKWHGFTPTDLVFPMFLFIVGISIYYAYKNKLPNPITYKKIAVRSLKLIGLGLFLGLFLPYFPFFKTFETARIPGVLQRIGIVFFIASILNLHCNWKWLFGIGLSLLVVYAFFLGLVPLPNGESPTFNRAPNNWANYLDLTILGKHMWKADYDPEGLLSTIPAVVTCISGILIGWVMDFFPKKRTSRLFTIGSVCLVLGYLFSVLVPINKALWTSTFVLVSSGYSIIILTIVYYITDVKQLKWGTIFKYVGMNAITIYFLSSFISKVFYLTKVSTDQNIHSYLFNSIFVHSFWSIKFASLLYAISVILFYLGLAYFLFRKKIILKV